MSTVGSCFDFGCRERDGGVRAARSGICSRSWAEESGSWDGRFSSTEKLVKSTDSSSSLRREACCDGGGCEMDEDRGGSIHATGVGNVVLGGSGNG